MLLLQCGGLWSGHHSIGWYDLLIIFIKPFLEVLNEDISYLRRAWLGYFVLPTGAVMLFEVFLSCLLDKLGFVLPLYKLADASI